MKRRPPILIELRCVECRGTHRLALRRAFIDPRVRLELTGWNPERYEIVLTRCRRRT